MLTALLYDLILLIQKWKHIGDLNKFILFNTHVQGSSIVGHTKGCQANILGISPTVCEAQI
jgi:hypothetical protein